MSDGNSNQDASNLDMLIREQMLADQLTANKLRRLAEADMEPRTRFPWGVLAASFAATLVFIGLVYGTLALAFVAVLTIGGAG